MAVAAMVAAEVSTAVVEAAAAVAAAPPFTAAEVSAVAARPFMAAASEVAGRCFMAAGFAPVMFSAAAAFATAGSRSGATAFTGTSMGLIMITRTIITRTVAAGSSGPITVHAASVTTATGTIADIRSGERQRDG